jgi:hypothetical protein
MLGYSVLQADFLSCQYLKAWAMAGCKSLGIGSDGMKGVIDSAMMNNSEVIKRGWSKKSEK